MALIGAMSLLDIDNKIGEIGYWIGSDYWGNGFASEACKVFVDFLFDHLDIIKIKGRHLLRNPASANVLLKSGFKHMGSDFDEQHTPNQVERIERYLCTKE